MTKEQRISGSGILEEFTREGNLLKEYRSYSGPTLTSCYISNGNVLMKNMLVPKVGMKRSIIRFSGEIGLRYTCNEYGNSINVCDASGSPIPSGILGSNESLNGVVRYYDIRDDLVNEWANKL